MQGTVLAGKYRLESLLGSGGMGSVWRAQHEELRAPVAVKLMEYGASLDSALLARFQHEAHAAASLRSPHVVQILDFGVDGASRVPFIVMEMLEGEPLSKRLTRLVRLSPPETARIAVEVGRALTRAHEAGIVHRDLKPDNIFLVQNGDDFVVKVLDFGIAKSSAALGPGLETRTGTVMGTPFYMSPEQISGSKQVDHRSDLWALAVVVFECLTGIRPFQADTIGGLVLKICTEPLPRPSACGPVPIGFDEWFARANAREPSWRFQSVQEMVSALCEVCGTPLSSARLSALPSPDALRAAPSAPPVVVTHPHAVSDALAPGRAGSTAVPLMAAPSNHDGGGAAGHGSSHTGHGAHAPMSLFEMMSYPFRDKKWPSRLTWLALLDYVPILNVIVLRGWRLEVARRFARGQQPVLPEMDRILWFIGQGCLLWFMTFLYSLVPIAIIFVMGWGGILGFWGDMWDLTKLIFTGASLAQVVEFSVRELLSSFFAAVVDSIWLIISLPLYRAAMIRYTSTGHLSSFFDVLGSIQYILAFPAAFAKLYLYSFLLSGFIAVGSTLLLMTGVGAVIVPLVSLPIYYWTTAAEYGHMGHDYLQYLAREPQAGRGHALRSLLAAAASVLLAGMCSASRGNDKAVSSGCGRSAGAMVARAAEDSQPSQPQTAARGPAVPQPAPAPTAPSRANGPREAAQLQSGMSELATTQALLDSYYADLNANRFDASKYFEPSVERYITMMGTTTSAMNNYIQRVFPTQYKQHHFAYEPGSISRESSGVFTYVERSSYYLVAKKKNLQQRYSVRIRVSPGQKMTFLHQYERLPWTPLPPSMPHAPAAL